MRLLFLLLAFVSNSAFAAFSATCVFDKYTSVYSETENESATTSIAQTMTIEEAKTSVETLKLDGKVRATNSGAWVALKNRSALSSKSHYAGDAGELLTVFHEVGDAEKELQGNFKSSLMSSGFYQSGVMYGQCTFN